MTPPRTDTQVLTAEVEEIRKRHEYETITDEWIDNIADMQAAYDRAHVDRAALLATLSAKDEEIARLRARQPDVTRGDVHQAIMIAIQFGDIGHFEGDPEGDPGEKLYVCTAEQMRNLAAVCDQATTAVMSLYEPWAIKEQESGR